MDTVFDMEHLVRGIGVNDRAGYSVSAHGQCDGASASTGHLAVLDVTPIG